jgi:hypothetical protein
VVAGTGSETPRGVGESWDPAPAVPAGCLSGRGACGLARRRTEENGVLGPMPAVLDVAGVL